MESSVEAAVQYYLNQMTPDQIARSNAYFEGGYWLLLWNLLFGILVAVFLMRLGISVKMRQWAERRTSLLFLRNWIYFIQYFIFTTLISLPLTIYQDFYREHKYDLSNLSFMAWLTEQGKGLMIGLLLGGFFLALLYVIIARLRRTWWAWGTLVSVVFLILVFMIAPVFITPLFNTYVPLPEGEVREQVLRMARSNGIPAQEIYLFDASKQSKRISANVSGMFATTRISLNDNLLNRTTLPEIRAVMGHEIGHYVLNHGLKFVMQFGLMLLLGFYFVFHALDFILRRFGHALGVRDSADPASAPILMALLSLYMFFATPVLNSIVRTGEAEADMFGLNLAREPDGFAKVALQLSEYRKISPGYWEEIFFFDHPSGESRIRMAMQWKHENPAPAPPPPRN